MLYGYYTLLRCRYPLPLLARTQVTLVDFGLVQLFRSGGKHCVEKADPKLKHNGTMEFCSRDAHRGDCHQPILSRDFFLGGGNILSSSLTRHSIK